MFFGGCDWACQDMFKVHRMTSLQILSGSLLDFPDFLDAGWAAKETLE